VVFVISGLESSSSTARNLVSISIGAENLVNISTGCRKSSHRDGKYNCWIAICSSLLWNINFL